MSREVFGMREPCACCPFRRGGQAVRVHPARAREIARMMLSSQGGTFPCHRTVDYSAGEEHGCRRGGMRTGEVHCAGALIFAEKNGTATQMMRIAERIGMYDRAKLVMDADVFDTLDEMIKANTPPKQRRKRA